MRYYVSVDYNKTTYDEIYFLEMLDYYEGVSTNKGSEFFTATIEYKAKFDGSGLEEVPYIK